MHVHMRDSGVTLPSKDANVDVEVTDESGRWGATFFTVRNIQTLMERWASTGEYGGGIYFWATHPVIVESLSEESVNAAIHDLRASGDFEKAFELLEASSSR